MRAICFYFQVHQPIRLRTYRFFDIGVNHNYYDDYQNKQIIKRVAEKCYLPMNQILLGLIKEYGKNFKVSFSISGTALDQMEWFAPEVLDSFKALAKTGCVEFLSETETHSLAALKSKDEFKKQVEAHNKRIKQLFGVTPTTFRNTELIYSDEIGKMVYDLGFKAMLTEGAKHILGWKSPNFLYYSALAPRLKMFLKNYHLSDDIAFRFSQQSWAGWPLTSEKFVQWLNHVDAKQEVVNLFMDYETFGEHQWKDTGIFEFFKALPKAVFTNSNYTFKTPKELVEDLSPASPVHVPHPISWADEERDLTAWLGNDMQEEAFEKLYALEEQVKLSKDTEIQKDWAYLQNSDHFYYMSTKWFSDGEVHRYFNPYASPYEAFINYMNVLSDFEIRLNTGTNKQINKTIINQKSKKMETTTATEKKATVKKAAKPAAKKATKPAAKKAAAKPAAKKAAKPAAKKAAKPAAKKATAKPAAKKAAKPAAKKATAKPAAKKATVKKATAKPAAKKATAKKATAKPAVKKAAKPAAKKATKPAAKKAVAKKK